MGMESAKGHTAIRVADQERSIKFYTEKVGLPIIREVLRDDGTRIVFLPGLEIWQMKDDERGVTPEQAKFLFHIGLEIDDIEASVKDLKSNGVEFHVPLAHRDFENQGIGVKYAFFKNPDGIQVELAQWYTL